MLFFSRCRLFNCTRKLPLLLCVCCSFSLSTLSAIGAEQTLLKASPKSASYIGQLKTSGYARVESNGEDSFYEWALTPSTPLSSKATRTWTQAARPVYVAENLYVVKKAKLLENSAHPASCDTSLDAVSRVIRSVSKMQGMKYYSNSDKKWAVLYDEAHLVDAADYKRRIADQTAGSADGKTLYCLLKDHTFGKGIYRVDYQQPISEYGEVSVCFSNATALKLLGITGVKPDHMKINLVVIDGNTVPASDAEKAVVADSYLIYMVLQATYPQMPLLENTLRKSFYARLDAIYNWFICQF